MPFAESSQLLLETNNRVTARKRKASTTQDSPRKRQRVANEPELKKASTEHIPATQTPGMTTPERGCDVLPSSIGPLGSKQHNQCSCFRGAASKADFEAEYLQLNRLAEGGFGSVYAGFRKTDNFPVAIKHIRQADVERQPTVLNGVMCQVPIEVLLLLKVAGPESVGRTGVVSILDWYDLEQEVLVIMERPVPSVDLLNYLDINDGPLKEDMAKTIMRQLVEAAIQIHSKGVFHRDIKPENVLIQTTSDGLRARVIDFGCGCISTRRPLHVFAGTTEYAPPEFDMYGSYKAGPTTVWQLGALLYEITDGYKQFTTTLVLRKRIKFNKELSQDCLDFLQRCLAVNPKDRITLEKLLLHRWLA
ncbi:Serine/threonine-protein kinase pim-2 [Channa argus]|uniref:non-specific serine/threonine protein kinase n=1 Tax=Channa argus TaxID=215402 RepID=A0A6G1QM17_CHAAH|nr:Serine/threonine-protein kinase pim-2 [Channa argus]